MQPIVDEGTPFISASLWAADATSPRPLVVVGAAPELASQPVSEVQDFFRRATDESTLALYDMLGESDRRLGYAATASGTPKFVVAAEAALPRDRRARVDRESAFSDLDYALYLGSTPDPERLLASSTGGARLSGRTESTTVPFGDSELLVVMSPQGQLGGALMANLWWILALMGVVLTVTSAALVERLTRQKRQAEDLAQENAELYATQRSVALTLQHSLLAEGLPEISGLELSARYVAAGEGIDIGGDWYDVIALEGNRVLVTVGDVSGRGLQAATAMASLRYAIRAYAAQGDTPGPILTKLSGLVNLRRDGHFATALCALVDLDAGTVTCASAGHPQPLLFNGEGSHFVSTDVGLPVGVRGGVVYSELTETLPPSGTLLFYTDGLIERRGESLSEGFDRLAHAATSSQGSLEATLSAILDEVTPQLSADDTALLGVRWTK
jgi:serine phosphatase RsbU (regulator of sigma subunit)